MPFLCRQAQVVLPEQLIEMEKRRRLLDGGEEDSGVLIFIKWWHLEKKKKGDLGPSTQHRTESLTP